MAKKKKKERKRRKEKNGCNKNDIDGGRDVSGKSAFLAPVITNLLVSGVELRFLQPLSHVPDVRAPVARQSAHQDHRGYW